MRLRLELGPPGAPTDPRGAGRPTDMGSTGGVDVEVRASAGTPLGAVRSALDRAAEWPDGTALRCGAMLLDDSSPMGTPPLVDGARIDAGCFGDAAYEAPDADADVHVVSGPDSGRAHPLGRHPIVIGRSSTADLQLRDAALSRRHLLLEPIGQGVRVTDLGSCNGSTVAALHHASPEAEQVGAVGVQASPGDLIGAGTTTLEVRRRDQSTAPCEPTGHGTYRVNRRPRPARPARAPDTDLPAAPTRLEAPRLNLLLVLLPLALCVVAAVVLANPIFVLFGLLSPVLTMSQWIGERRSRRREHDQAMARHTAAVQRLEADLAARARAELTERRRRCPDPAQVITVAQRRLATLWERRQRDEDALTVRLGTGAVCADSHLRVQGSSRHPLLHGAPVELDLAARGCVGLCGDREAALAVAASAVAQLATWNSPGDLRLAIFASGPTRLSGWRWAEWLPHVSHGDDIRVLDVLNHTGADPRLSSMLADLAAPHGSRANSPTGDRPDDPRTVIVVDGSLGLREHPHLGHLFAPRSHPRRHLMFLADSPSSLPVECDAIIDVATDLGHLRTTGSCMVSPMSPMTFVPDLPDGRWRLAIGRALAPLRDPRPGGTDTLPPSDVALVDLFQIDPTDADAVLTSWQTASGTTRTPIGVGAHGIHRLDLRRDGPHVLVGGMTGSGKSELLRTLITGLAVGNKPDDLGFVLIDYKGGSAFDGCAALPHVLGLVTDLEGNLTTRALLSLRAELRRREALLRAAGVDDLDRYAAARERDPGLAPLPRLVIVVDEFRALAEEHPTFMPGLVRVATQGRSLGMHLVLATQRPSGAVSAEIRANTNLRMALRVRDAIDSHDIVESDVAAALPAAIPGRAVLRAGGGDLVEVQIARADSPRSHAPAPRVTLRSAVRDAPATEPGAEAIDAAGPGHDPERRSPSPELVAALTSAALRSGWLPPGADGDQHPHTQVRRPWLPELPRQIDTTALPRAPRTGPGEAGQTSAGGDTHPRIMSSWTMRQAGSCGHRDVGAVGYGLLDDPSRQARLIAHWHANGNLGVVGSPGSGRTTTLLTVALASARSTCSGMLHLYGIDGGGGLAALTDLQHAGAVVPVFEELRLRALVTRLTTELRGREAGAAQRGCEAGAAQRGARPSPDTRHPIRPAARILVLIDDWERVREALESIERGAAAEEVVALLRHGPSVGIHVVITGGRSLLVGPVAGLLPDLVVLRLDDPADSMLAGLSVAELPTGRGGSSSPPGRGLVLPQRLEIQVATTTPQLIGRAVGPPPPSEPVTCEPAPFRIDPLPGRVTLADVTTGALASGLARTATPTTVWIGTGFEGPVGLDIGEGALVCGPRGSGRTTTLLIVAAGISRIRRPWLVVTGSPRRFDGIALGTTVAPDDLPALRRALLEPAPDLVVLVDDVDLLLDGAVEDALLGLGRLRAGAPIPLVAAGESRALATRFRGLATAVRTAPAVVALNPGIAERDLLGAPLPDVRAPRNAAAGGAPRAAVLSPSSIDGVGGVGGWRVAQVAAYDPTIRDGHPSPATGTLPRLC